MSEPDTRGRAAADTAVGRDFRPGCWMRPGLSESVSTPAALPKAGPLWLAAKHISTAIQSAIEVGCGYAHAGGLRQKVPGGSGMRPSFAWGVVPPGLARRASRKLIGRLSLAVEAQKPAGALGRHIYRTGRDFVADSVWTRHRAWWPIIRLAAVGGVSGNFHFAFERSSTTMKVLCDLAHGQAPAHRSEEPGSQRSQGIQELLEPVFTGGHGGHNLGEILDCLDVVLRDGLGDERTQPVCQWLGWCTRIARPLPHGLLLHFPVFPGAERLKCPGCKWSIGCAIPPRERLPERKFENLQEAEYFSVTLLKLQAPA